jgi:uncharacterized protein
LEEVRNRIEKDIEKFHQSVKRLEKIQLTAEEKQIVELAQMYNSDAKSWLERGDFYTSFSSVAYAHGLLDAVLKMKKIIE